MKVKPTFNNILKDMLNDYRNLILSLDEIIAFLDKYYKNKYNE